MMPPGVAAFCVSFGIGRIDDTNSFLHRRSAADLLHGDYKQSEYGNVILPFTVLRRLDCVLEATNPAVLAELTTRQKAGLNPEPFLLAKSIQRRQHFVARPEELMGDQDQSAGARGGRKTAGLLYLATEKFAHVDLHPDVVSNAKMGAVFEEPIRNFAELFQ
jgi:type I restriction enzyme M protein